MKNAVKIGKYIQKKTTLINYRVSVTLEIQKKILKSTTNWKNKTSKTVIVAKKVTNGLK